MYIIKESKRAEITVLKSIFICDIIPIKNELEVKEHLKKIKKEFFDARHHVYAYAITNDNMQIEKCSDDGEPAKTAGAPLLSIIKNKELTNVLVVVTRYFGGTLLGTGGLVRAYSNSLLEALKISDIIKLVETKKISLLCSYKDYQNILNLNYEITNSMFQSDVYLEINIAKDEADEAINNINKITNGQAKIILS